MTPIYQTAYNIISQSPFDLLAVFSCPIDGMIEPVVTGYPESLKATEFVEKVLKTISNEELEWLIAITDGNKTVSFQRLHFRVPESFVISCGEFYLLLQPNSDGGSIVSFFRQEGVIKMQDILNNRNPIRTSVIPQWNACVLFERIVAEMRQGKGLENLLSVFDELCS